jgi:hypothetical protein
MRAAPFNDKKFFRVTHGVEEEAGSQIDPPSFSRVLHKSIGLYGVVGKMSGSAAEAWLEHVKEGRFHLLRQWHLKFTYG